MEEKIFQYNWILRCPVLRRIFFPTLPSTHLKIVLQQIYASIKFPLMSKHFYILNELLLTPY